MRKSLKKLSISLLAITIMVFSIVPTINVKAAVPTMDIYVVWDCNNEVCVSDAITVNTYLESNETRTYSDNNILSSTVKDSTKNVTLKAQDVSSYNYAKNSITRWYIYSSLPSDIRTFSSWEDLDVAIHEEDYERGIDPTGGKDGVKSISHNGDRDFRVTFYDSAYESLTFDVNPDNYTYYLGEWDPVFANPTLDISGTTKDKPAEYTTYLLEDTLIFSAGAINAETIESVKALDVADKGVSITKSNGNFTIKFKSNYYSEVTFEVTGANGGKYYFKVNRSFVTFADNSELVQRGVESTRKAYAEFTYPSTTSYEDYDVFATITTSNGIVTKKLTATTSKVVNPTWDGRDPDSEYITSTVLNGGENLKKVRYALDIDKNVEDVSITVTKKNATSSNSYGGTFGGYAKGVPLDISMYKMILSRA